MSRYRYPRDGQVAGDGDGRSTDHRTTRGIPDAAQSYRRLAWRSSNLTGSVVSPDSMTRRVRSRPAGPEDPLRTAGRHTSAAEVEPGGGANRTAAAAEPESAEGTSGRRCPPRGGGEGGRRGPECEPGGRVEKAIGPERRSRGRRSKSSRRGRGGDRGSMADGLPPFRPGHDPRSPLAMDPSLFPTLPPRSGRRRSAAAGVSRVSGRRLPWTSRGRPRARRLRRDRGAPTATSRTGRSPARPAI